ncbi:MAG: hypothetical protein NZ740_00735 [Kiritimatiellae bacterium]|nr:hypothetical protein [Kiritimatiellia bacterium]MDW8457616.1 hypothetical protein [Verrucomicrobiota bacterium]
MNARRLAFWLLAFGAAGAALWWAFHVPRTVRGPWNAVPADATWVTAHQRLAGRWDVLSENRLLKSLAGAMGVETEDWEALIVSPEIRRVIDWLGQDELILAYVPSMPLTGRPAWVFAAWLGGRSQRLRWSLKSVDDPTLKPASARNGWRVWVWTPKGLKGGERITFSIVEGMVVGCIAADAIGIEDVLACVDGLAPSLADTAAPRTPPDEGIPDWGWVRIGNGQDGGSFIRFAMDFRPNGGFRGKVAVPGGWPAAVATDSSDLKELAALLGERPTAVLVAGRPLAAAWLAKASNNLLGREFAALFGSSSTGAAGFALLGGPFSGRYRAVRLPTLVGGFSTETPDSVVADVQAALDRINAATPWGLVLHPISVGTQRVYAIESTGRSAYAAAEMNERLAFAVLGRSVVFSSNAGALLALLRESRSAADHDVDQTSLSAALGRMHKRNAGAYLGFDLTEGAKMARLAITAWSLKLLIENPTGSLPFRERLNAAKGWIDAIAPQRKLEVWALPGPGRIEYEFALGDEL